MTQEIKATVILPFELDLRKETLFMKNLQREADLILTNLRVTKTQEMIILPLIGNVMVNFDQLPNTNEPTSFNICFANCKQPSHQNNLTEDNEDAFFQITNLPQNSWDDYWQRIYIDDSIKQQVFNYCLLTHNLSKRELSPIALAQHRLLILCGPPGTGKTSLARGLANQVAKVLTLQNGINLLFVEINAHKLSSKWLGESPKLIQKAFIQVAELVSNNLPVICLIDEVETLSANRNLTFNSANPVDVFRSVNSLLQQLDRVVSNNNVYTIATSNLPQAIDPAFLDRADLNIYVDLPNVMSRKKILEDIFQELNTKINTKLPNPQQALSEEQQQFWDSIIAETTGFSGRQLRKVIAEAMIFDNEVASQPEKLEFGHILQAIINNKKHRVIRTI